MLSRTRSCLASLGLTLISGTCLAFIVATAPATPPASGAYATPAAWTARTSSGPHGNAGDACKFSLHITVTKHGDASYAISGPCSPSRSEVRRIARMIGNPSWLHIGHIRPHSAVVCGGNCDSSAEVTDRGQAFTS